MNKNLTAPFTDDQCDIFIEQALECSLPVLREISDAQRAEHFASSAADQSIRTFGQLPIDPEKLNAAILNATMLVFPEGMNRRYKTIIKRTYLFADLSAQIKFPKDEDQQQRWEYMIKGMKVMGWTSFNNAHVSYEETSSGLTISNLVLDIVQAAIGGVTGGGVGTVLKAGAQAAIGGLKGNKEALSLYEKNGKKGDGANFGVASIAQDKEGDVYMVLGGITYFTAAGNTKVAFFDKTHASGSVYQSKAAFTIYEDDYTAKKEAAADKFYEALNEALELEFGI